MEAIETEVAQITDAMKDAGERSLCPATIEELRALARRLEEALRRAEETLGETVVPLR